MVRLVYNWYTFSHLFSRPLDLSAHEGIYRRDRRKLRRRVNLKKDAKLISYCLSVQSAIAWIEIVQDFPEIL